MLLNPTSVHRKNAKWSIIAITILSFVGLFIATTIVLSLIPVYLAANTVAANRISSRFLTFSYNISADQLNLTLPISTLPASALLILQTDLQGKLDANSKTANSKITVLSGQITGGSTGGKKRRRQTTNLVELTINATVVYPPSCTATSCQTTFVALLYSGVLTTLNVSFSQLQQAIIASETTTAGVATTTATAAAVATTTTTTTAAATTTATTTAAAITATTTTATTTARTTAAAVATTTTTTTAAATTTATTTAAAITATTTTATTTARTTAAATATTTTNGAFNLYTSTVTTTAAITTTTTNGAFNLYTSTITTTVAVTSGGVGSYSPYSTTINPGGRRRRSVIQPTQIASHMPIGGCLIIGPEKDHINSTQDMYQKHAFVKYLPLGVDSLPAVDGNQIDLYRFLRENKLSKSTYNQLVIQDHLVNGHYLTLGALGCLEAHVSAWQHVINVNRPMLILEDDAQLLGELFDSILPYLLYSLPTNFSLLYFGNLVGESMQSKLLDYNDLLWKINGSNWGTYAYLISPQAAATLLDSIYPVHAQVDSMIIDIAQSQSLDAFMSKQMLVRTDNTYHRKSSTQRYFVPPIVIPRVLHFIWLSNNPLPTAAQRNIQQWKNLHPNWQIRLWTNESIEKSDLIIYNKDRFQHSTRSGRQASDILRYEIVNQYGGIYADVDFEPLKNLEPLLHGVDAFVVHENDEFVCNGIYGAIPAHELSERLVTELESSWKDHANGTVNQQTGPYHMTRQVKAMKEENKTTMKTRFQMFAPHLFFPYAWYEKDPGHPYDPLAFTVHHFRAIAEIARDAQEGY